MGGNARAYLKSTGQYTQAEKIPLQKIGRNNFVKKITDLLKKINAEYYKKYKSKLWENEGILQNGMAFNGSTSYIMNPKYNDFEIEKFKPTAGDLDIAVPEDCKLRLSVFLDNIEGKEIIKGVRYMGCNQNGLGDQINAVFLIKFSDEITVAAQVDFEFLPFENNSPTEWGKFSHSSSFEDQKEGVKAVFHKYMIRAIIGAMGTRTDIVIATKTSTPDNIKLSNSKVHQIPKMLKFSVQKGVRTAYEPIIDPKTHEICMVNGKKVYKEIPTSASTFENSLKGIFALAFGTKEPSRAEMELFWSFKGVCQLMRKYLTKQQIDATVNRFEELIWGTSPQYAQEIEMTNPEWDYATKIAGYKKLVELLHVKDKSKALATAYYKAWKREGDASKVLANIK